MRQMRNTVREMSVPPNGQPRVGAVRGLLKKACWARAHVCTRACELIEEVPFTRRSGAGCARVRGREGEGEGEG